MSALLKCETARLTAIKVSIGYLRHTQLVLNGRFGS